MAKATEAAKLDWNISELVKRMRKNEIDFSVPIQRGYVWDNKRDSLLIHSILIGYPISIFFFNRVGKKFEGLEGKQRARAIFRFVNNEFKLHANTPNVVEEDETVTKIARCNYNNLSEDLKNRILRYGLTVQCFDNMTTEDKVDFFTRINSGKPVTATEIARIKVQSRDVFLSLVEHPAIVNGVSDKNKGKCLDEDIVEDIWCMTYNENPSLLNKHRAPLLENNIVTDEQRDEIITGLDYLYAFYQAIGNNKKLLSKVRPKTHVVSLGYMGILAARMGLSQEEYVDKARKFFGGEGRTSTISGAYNIASQSGSAKPEQVRIRMDEIEKALR